MSAPHPAVAAPQRARRWMRPRWCGRRVRATSRAPTWAAAARRAHMGSCAVPRTAGPPRAVGSRRIGRRAGRGRRCRRRCRAMPQWQWSSRRRWRRSRPGPRAGLQGSCSALEGRAARATRGAASLLFRGSVVLRRRSQSQVGGVDRFVLSSWRNELVKSVSWRSRSVAHHAFKPKIGHEAGQAGKPGVLKVAGQALKPEKAHPTLPTPAWRRSPPPARPS